MIDAVVISGIIAVLLAEFIGKQGKMQEELAKKHMRFENSEFVSSLGNDKRRIKYKNKEEDDTMFSKKYVLSSLVLLSYYFSFINTANEMIGMKRKVTIHIHQRY